MAMIFLWKAKLSLEEARALWKTGSPSWPLVPPSAMRGDEQRQVASWHISQPKSGPRTSCSFWALGVGMSGLAVHQTRGRFPACTARVLSGFLPGPLGSGC